MTYSELVASYGDKVIFLGSEEFIPINLSRKFLEDACDQNLGVIGIEIFRIKNAAIHPRIDLIADWSSLLKEKLGLPQTIVKIRQFSLEFLDKAPDDPDFFANFCCLSAEKLEESQR